MASLGSSSVEAGSASGKVYLIKGKMPLASEAKDVSPKEDGGVVPGPSRACPAAQQPPIPTAPCASQVQGGREVGSVGVRPSLGQIGEGKCSMIFVFASTILL